MIKILKNKRIDLDTNEYIIYDCSKQESERKKLSVDKARELVKMFDMETISPATALEEQLFHYKEVKGIDYPLPF